MSKPPVVREMNVRLSRAACAMRNADGCPRAWRRGRIARERVTLPPSSSAACHGQRGSFRMPRPIATRSAWPSATIASAWCGSRIRPTAIVAMPTSVADALARTAPGSRAPSGIARDAVAAGRDVDVVAAEVAAARARTRRRRRASRPRSSQSVPLQRTPSGRCAGHAARTAANTSSGKRMRFSRLPPYASVRWLAMGDRNELSR